MTFTFILMIDINSLFLWRVMLIIGRCYREHCVLVISFEQLLTIVRIIQHKVLLEKLLNQF